MVGRLQGHSVRTCTYRIKGSARQRNWRRRIPGPAHGWSVRASYPCRDGTARAAKFPFDFAVDDLDQAETLLLEWGAVKPDSQPGGGRWRVFIDPAGHPFCLTRS
ncbi:VOC family protein [Streptomyces nigrescens]